MWKYYTKYASQSTNGTYHTVEQFHNTAQFRCTCQSFKIRGLGFCKHTTLALAEWKSAQALAQASEANRQLADEQAKYNAPKKTTKATTSGTKKKVAYVIVENQFEYNDEVYLQEDGYIIKKSFTNKETAIKECRELNKKNNISLGSIKNYYSTDDWDAYDHDEDDDRPDVEFFKVISIEMS